MFHILFTLHFSLFTSHFSLLTSHFSLLTFHFSLDSQLLSGTNVVTLDTVQLAELGNGGAIALGNLRQSLSTLDGHRTATSRP